MDKSFINRKRTAKTQANPEVGGEYILPNDLPDVKRILHVFSRLKKNGCFFDPPGVTADAELSYLIVYSGDDGKLHSVKYAAPFTARSQAGGDDDADTVTAFFSSPDTQIRLSNPRKFQIKSRIPVQFSVYGKEERTPYIEGVQDFGLQCLEKSGVTYSVSSAREDGIPFSLDVSIPDTCPEPEAIISSYATASLPAVNAAEDKAEISFTVDLTFLYTTTDGGVSSYKSTAQISHELAADGMKPDSVCRGSVCIDELSCELTTDKSGEMRVIETDLTYNAEVLYETAECGVYVADMYSTEYESKETYGDMTLRHALPVYSAHFTLSESEDKKTKGDIIFSTAACDKYELSFEDTAAILTGELDLYMITEEDGEYEGRTSSFPFRIVLQYTGNENDEYEADVSVSSPSVRSDGTRLISDAELYVSVYGTEYETVQTLSAMTITDAPIGKERPSLRLYRADPGETEWDTAKKFRVSASELQKANEENSKRIYIIPG